MINFLSKGIKNTDGELLKKEIETTLQIMQIVFLFYFDIGLSVIK